MAHKFNKLSYYADRVFSRNERSAHSSNTDDPGEHRQPPCGLACNDDPAQTWIKFSRCSSSCPNACHALCSIAFASAWFGRTAFRLFFCLGVSFPLKAAAASATPASDAAGWMKPAHEKPTSSKENAAKSLTGLKVAGTQLMKDGKPFKVKGVIFEGLVAPDVFLSAAQRLHRLAFAKRSLSLASTWHVNTIRFNFSQPALDPKSPMYNASSYISEITSAVSLARRMGFVVIVADQDEKNVHDPEALQTRMPSEATLRDDLTLANLFKADQGVMIDLFNEPNMKPSVENWDLWFRGGTFLNDGRQTETLVGFQTLVMAIRAHGANNILLVDSINTFSFEGIQSMIQDPANNIVYDPHLLNPTNRHRGNQSDSERDFGFLVDRGKTVIVGAFNASTSHPAGSNKPARWCSDDPKLERPTEFLNYLKKRGIGVIGWAFDFPGSIVSDYNGTPTTYVGKRCGDPDGGSGELLRRHFS